MDWLIAQFGIDRLHSAQVVLPTDDFFPDSYTPSPEGAQVMLDKMCDYMGIDQAVVDLQFFQDRNPLYENNDLRHGAAGIYEAVGGKYRIWVEVGNLNDPLALIATMAHELAHVHLLGHGRISADVEDHEPLTDLLTVFLGLGVITANAVIRESYWNVGGMSGWQMGRRGYLAMPSYGYALALFARARGEEEPSWASHLRPDVRSAFRAASGFLAKGGETRSSSGLLPSFDRPRLDSNALEEEQESKEQASLTHEEFLDALARGEKNFRDLDLRGILLRGANLTRVDLTGADLRGADLTAAVLTESDLSDADLRGAVLTAAILRKSSLRGADLRKADLSKADFEGADIRDADLAGSSLQQASLTGVIRDETTDFTGVDFSEVHCDANMSQEIARAKVVATLADRSWRAFSWFFVGGFAAILGGLAGLLLAGIAGGGFRGNAHLGNFGACAGAILFVLVAIRKQARSRKEESKKNLG